MVYLIGTKCLAAAKRFVKRGEEGASLVEYGLLIALIALVCIAAITLVGTNISAMFNYIAGQIPQS